ncbi:NAD(P)-dependent oxidoreductase [Cytobacillus firmus]|uniref:NAD(P)-dependent oxidoreductase n=1 Tax=Cytobacillus firmus TaxID=1399 RepID=UPI0018CDC25C|nr:NAD(P)-dependent oxidoreductase [Cytobacillus firmus]MED4450659.1 NAD(P)-dependent oxidoreductase [Cytobacillus firmus]MED4768769.1 NAD(P)-dependent oxidoreductase [Cytobacillus firmus]
MKLLLTGAFKYSEEQLENLKSLGYEILYIQDERVPLEIDVSDVDAVVCNGLFLYNDIKKFESLKFVQLTSAGLDRVPLDYIKDHGIKLFNAKGVYSVPMAEWVVLKILEIYKKSRKFYEAQREHKWEKQRDLFELTNKTAAIIGFGDVGAEVAKRLKAFDVKVVGVGRRKKESIYIDEYYLINEITSVA